MLIAWIIGIIPNLILVYVWNYCYITEHGYENSRIPVNILIAILFIIIALIPILNIISAVIFAMRFKLETDCYDIEWRFPKWMTKKIK